MVKGGVWPFMIAERYAKNSPHANVFYFGSNVAPFNEG